MAFTYTVADKTTFGNKHVHFATVVADAAAGSVNTGLGHVVAVEVTLKSATTGAYKVRANALESGTSAAGYVAISGVASGDEFFVTVYGR
jgi:hypothetical protein